MKLSNRCYDILKYVCTIALPSIGTFLGIVFLVTGVGEPTANIVLTIISAAADLIGALIGVSNAQYKKEIAEKGKITFINNEDK